MVNTSKMGLDDFLIEYNKNDLSKIMKDAKTFDTLEMRAELLIEGISSVNNAENISWVVPELFAKKHISFLFGEAGCKKTWLLLDIGLNLTMGCNVLNGVEVEQSKVLLFEGDVPDTTVKERLALLGSKLNDSYFKYINRYNADRNGVEISLSNPKGRKYIETCIKKFRPDIIFFDTLISFIDVDESKQDEMKKIVDALRKFACDYDCHILICHHARKRDAGEKRVKLDQSDLIGSSVLNRLASLIIAVNKGEKEEQSVMSISKTWFKSPFEALSFELVPMPENRLKLVFDTYTEAHTKTEKKKKKIVEYIKLNQKTDITRKELVEALGDEPAIKTALKKLEMDCYIKGEGNTKNRIYTVIPPE